MVIYTAALQDSQPNRLNTRLPCQHIIVIYTAAVPEQIQTIYTAAVCSHKIAIYTTAIQEPNRLFTLLSGCYLHGNNSRANSAIYIAAGCMNMKLLFTLQPFKSQIGYI